MDTLHSERYINLIFIRIFPELTEGEILYCYFQKDSAKAHIASYSIASISDVFGDII
jgi:hypothetical protein